MTIVNQQYRKLNPAGSTPREISEVVNNLMDGKSNNTGEITLNTGGATSTTIYNERIGYSSVIILVPNSSAASNIALPYGAWQDSADQSAASITTAYPITFNTIDYENGVTLTSGSRLNASYSGLYNIQFSFQLSNLANSTENVSVWFRKNGTDVAGSNSEFGLAPRKNSTDPYHVIASMNFFLALAKNDYAEIMWSTTNTLVTIDAKGTQTSPTIPSTPSVITTMNYVSTNGFTTNIFEYPYISDYSKGQATISHSANTTADLTYRYIVVG
jgi:hypothetical protein